MATYQDYMLMDKLPHTWCAGCGHGIVLQSIAAAFAQQGWDKHDIALVSGIGCFGRVDDYLDVNCMHVTHGRALAAATGVALSNPDLHVVVTMGDGDGATIGGNHLIHSARRNINVTAIVSNNNNYGQTGGQYSGTTPTGSITSTSPYGHIEPPFDLCKLVAAAGAAYVARATTYQPAQMRRLIAEGMNTKGFALIEVMSSCPTHYGRYNRQGQAVQMMQYLDQQSISAQQAAGLSEEELADKIIVGRIASRTCEDYYTKYKRVIDAQMEGGSQT